MDLDSEYPSTARDQIDRRNEIQATMKIAAILFASLLVFVFVVSYWCFRMKRMRRQQASGLQAAEISPNESSESPGASPSAHHGSGAVQEALGTPAEEEKVDAVDRNEMEPSHPQDMAERKVNDLSDDEGDKSEVRI
jgi:flagellar biosynthesis/type III secretory pathway M-ring protein FliF/YscJ